MNNVGDAFKKISEDIAKERGIVIETDKEKLLQKQADLYNLEKGNLPDINGKPCPYCNNKGMIAFAEDGEFKMKRCKCSKTRKVLANIEKSGLSDIIRIYTIKNYQTTEQWQTMIKEKATDFLNQEQYKWFFIGGQVGSGKSMICTAMCGELIKKGLECRYMLWREESARLKSLVCDTEEYDKRINDFKRVEVLYIDDFLKVKKGEFPTSADINLAFDIINYRYNQRNGITIISSEYLLSTILQIDEATGSRILEKCGRFETGINYDERKNIRMKL